MQDKQELLEIRKDLERRFRPANPITQAITEKLAVTLHQQRRCEYLIQVGRSFPAHKVDELPAEKRQALTESQKKLLERLQVLKRSAREYSAALRVATPQTNSTSAEMVP
jgi:hypothetical protein